RAQMAVHDCARGCFSKGGGRRSNRQYGFGGLPAFGWKRWAKHGCSLCRQDLLYASPNDRNRGRQSYQDLSANGPPSRVNRARRTLSEGQGGNPSERRLSESQSLPL